MQWISVDDELPKDGETVIAVRQDGWWDRIKWTKEHGWADHNNTTQPIVKWLRELTPAIIIELDNAIEVLDPEMLRQDIILLRERLISFKSQLTSLDSNKQKVGEIGPLTYNWFRSKKGE